MNSKSILVYRLLHFIDGFDKVEEGLGTFGFIGDVEGSLVGWLEYGGIFELLEDITAEVKLL